MNIEVFAQILQSDWIPSSLELDTIEKEFGELLKQLGISWDSDSSIRPRPPERSIELANGNDSSIWHQDGHDGFYPYALVFWSNGILPDIKDSVTGMKLETKPYDIVLVRNRIALHKTPIECKDLDDRLLCQAWISHKNQVNLK